MQRRSPATYVSRPPDVRPQNVVNYNMHITTPCQDPIRNPVPTMNLHDLVPVPTSISIHPYRYPGHESPVNVGFLNQSA